MTELFKAECGALLTRRTGMSSGVGVFTEKGRCYPFWLEFLKCKASRVDPRTECKTFIGDYMECLHHTKEVRRDC